MAGHGASNLVAQPLGPAQGFNWVFLIEILVVITLVIFFLFYFNRLFSTLISYIIRAYTWHRYHAYIDITSLQISPLGGRLFFKTVRYHGRNQTILIHDGRITWRYWFSRAQKAEIFSREHDSLKSEQLRDEKFASHDTDAQPSTPVPTNGPDTKPSLPCRLHVRVSGVEAFFYNRSPVYDDLLTAFRDASHGSSSLSSPSAKLPPDFQDLKGGTSQERAVEVDDGFELHPSPDRIHQAPALPAFLRALPIQIECKKAAAVIGNDHTRTVVVAKTERANGKVDAAPSGPLDIFKALFLFDLEDVTVSLKTNADFQTEQSSTDINLDSDNGKHKRQRHKARHWPGLRTVTDLIHNGLAHLRLATPARTPSLLGQDAFEQSRPSSNPQDPSAWQGLARFLDEHEAQEDDQVLEQEYARFSSIADCPSISFRLFWDVPGPVPTPQQMDCSFAAPPVYGLDLKLRGGVINYGPWADRQRVELQNIFFPSSFVDWKPAKLPKTGETRLVPAFVLNMSLGESVTLRLPTREPSKDWKWRAKPQSKAPGNLHRSRTSKKRTNASRSQNRARSKVSATRADLRPFGWIDWVVQAETTVQYHMDQTASSHGYTNTLAVEIPGAEVMSSVNNALLFKTGHLSVSGNLSVPLGWRTLRIWSFDISCDHMELYILRDHMFLVTDLVTDWSTGDPPDFHTFVPFRYSLNLLLRHSNLILNTNDANVIDDATNHDDNNLVSLEIATLKALLVIPLELYRPATSSIPFDVCAENLSLRLLSPPRVTYHHFLVDKELATLSRLTLTGSHSYFSEQSPTLTDNLRMHIRGDSLVLMLYGMLMRHLINFKENYFGDFIHYRTSQELSCEHDPLVSTLAEDKERFAFRRSNDLDVHLNIVVNDPIIYLPTRLYSPGDLLRLTVSSANVDLRVANHFLDLQVDAVPLVIGFVSQYNREPLDGHVTIDGFSFQGHRLFGLPPAEPAYVSTWMAEVGLIDGILPLSAIRMIVVASKVFAFTMSDHENAIPLFQGPHQPDVDMVHCNVAAISCRVPVAGHMFGLTTGPLVLEFDDLIDMTSASRLRAVLPDIQVICTSSDQSRTPADERSTSTIAVHKLLLQTSVRIALRQESSSLSEDRRKQQAYLSQQDDRSRRTSFLIHDTANVSPLDPMQLGPPAMFLSSLAVPLSPVGTSAAVSRRSFEARMRTRAKSDGSAEVASIDTDDQATQNIVVIDLEPKLRGAISSDLLHLIFPILSAMDSTAPEDVLDTFQMDVVKRVEKALRSRHGQRHNSNLRVNVPTIDVRIDLFPFNAVEITAHRVVHHIDISLNGVTASTMITSPSTKDQQPSTAGIHVEVKTLSMVLSCTQDADRDGHELARVDVEQIMSWCATSTTTSAHLSLDVLTAVLSGRKPEAIALLLVRCSSIEDTISSFVARHGQKLLYDTRRLMQSIDAHRMSEDSAHLGRLRYVLRACPEHLRNQESWRMISRIRWAFMSIQADLVSSLLSSEEPQSLLDEKDILQNWAHWCTWDVPDPEDSQVCKALYGDSDNIHLADKLHQSLFVAHTGTVRIMIEAGADRPSEILVTEQVTQVSVLPPSPPAGLLLSNEHLRTLVVVQSTAAAILLNLRWSMLDLIEPVADATLSYLGKSSRDMPNAADQELRNGTPTDYYHEIHSVCHVGKASIVLHTPHLQHTTTLEGLQSSMLKLPIHSSDNDGVIAGTKMSVVAHATKTLIDFKGNGVHLGVTELIRPVVYIEQQQMYLRHDPKLDVGITYDQLNLSSDEDPVGLVPLISQVVSDEVCRLQRLLDGLKTSGISRSEPTQDGSGHDMSLPDICLTLLAGSYRVDIALFDSMKQSLVGERINLRLHSNKTLRSYVNMDVTASPTSYSLSGSEISSLDTTVLTPAISVSIRLIMGLTRVNAVIGVVVGPTNIEAAMLYNTIVLLRHSGMEAWLKRAMEGMLDIHQQVTRLARTIEAKNLPQDSAKNTRRLSYRFDIDIAGGQIVGRAPLSTSCSGSAHLLLGLGPVRASAKSADFQQISLMTFPAFDVRLSSIYAGLEIEQPPARVACGHAKSVLAIRYLAARDGQWPSARILEIHSNFIDVQASTVTIMTLVDIITHMDEKIGALDIRKRVKRLRNFHRERSHPKADGGSTEDCANESPRGQASIIPSLALQLNSVNIAWTAESTQYATPSNAADGQDLHLTFEQITLATQRDEYAQLVFRNTSLRMCIDKSVEQDDQATMLADLPEIVFAVQIVSETDARLVQFNATGEAIYLKLHSHFFRPFNALIRSARLVSERCRTSAQNWHILQDSQITPSHERSTPRRVRLLRVQAKFAGATMHLRSDEEGYDHAMASHTYSAARAARNAADDVIVKTPGVALNIEYSRARKEPQEPSLTVEVQLQASSNSLTPDLVLFVTQLSKEVRSELQAEQPSIDTSGPSQEASSLLPDSGLLSSNDVWSKTRVNFALRIGKQEFQLSCQPYARIDAKVTIGDIYIVANTIEGSAQDRLFSMTARLSTFAMSLQHVYSREATLKFRVDALNVSALTNKHKGEGSTGMLVSVVLEPIQSTMNARQLQDLLLFQDVWLPNHSPEAPQTAKAAADSDRLIQRYRQITSATAYPWDAVVAFKTINLDIDFGQSIGKHNYRVNEFWARSTKSANWQQELCMGLEQALLTCTGRMGGILDVRNILVKTSIEWPAQSTMSKQTPLISATTTFEKLQVKASFDYQPFVFADVGKFYFLMYNVRDKKADRLVATLDGAYVTASCTAISPAQAVGMYDAFVRLVQEKQAAYRQASREMAQVVERKYRQAPTTPQMTSMEHSSESTRLAISLRSRVSLSLGQISFGVYPNTFSDNQLLRLDASGVQARVLIGLEDKRIHSNLSMSLGQLQVALAAVKRLTVGRSFTEISTDEVIKHGLAARGGTILRVPRVVASMQTWQEAPVARCIDYIFFSTFQGKVDVGWNYARVTFIRGMWNAHTRSLAARLNKPLPQSAVKITTSPARSKRDTEADDDTRITAVINMPETKYEYRALRDPVIETPQLRDMGEATPPLEWIGLNREKLPSVVHHVVIMALLEVAKEVEGAYGRILGAS